MYVVMNTTTNTFYGIGLDKEELEADIVAMNKATGDDFQLFSPVSDKTPEQLELLYGLTLELLKVGKINPLFIRLTRVGLLGDETEITALQVLNDARNWIDAHVQD